MGIEENKDVVRRYFELYNQHDLDSAYEILTPGCFGEGVTLEQSRQLDIMIFKSFPDWKITILDMVAEGDKVAFIENYTGTHTGEPYMGIPPMGKKQDFNATRILRIVDYKIVEIKGTEDLLSSAQQLGVLPSIQEAIKTYKEAHNKK